MINDITWNSLCVLNFVFNVLIFPCTSSFTKTKWLAELIAYNNGIFLTHKAPVVLATYSIISNSTRLIFIIT